MMSDKGGLEDVTVCRSSICHIDGNAGRLLYRGYDVRDLVKYSSFEETAYLLLNGKLPNRAEFVAFTDEIYDEYQHIRLALMRVIERLAVYGKHDPMAILQATVPLLGMTHFNDSERGQKLFFQAVRLIGVMPAMICGYDNPHTIIHASWRSCAETFLRLLKGRVPDERESKIFDTCLILHAEHELNASTFTARITASTGTDMFAAVSAAIGALSGPKHGGANKQVMRMMKSVKNVEELKRHVQQLFSNKKKVPGFGHRVYKQTSDPRAVILKDIARKLCEIKGKMDFYELFETAERMVDEEKGLKPNVDFYAACVYNQLGIPDELFTPIFAMARTVGWAAHVLEQERDTASRIIRPCAEYVGEMGKTYVPIQERN